MEGDDKSMMRSHEVPKKEVQTAENPEWLLVYLCKMPVVVEGFKKLRVAFIEKKKIASMIVFVMQTLYYL